MQCRYNFNSLPIYEYATARIKLQEDEANGDAIFRLMRMQEFYESIKVEERYYYRPHRPTLAAMIADHIEDRVHLKRREMLAAEGIAAPIGPDSQKVNTSLTCKKRMCAKFIMRHLRRQRKRSFLPLIRNTAGIEVFPSQ